MPLQNRVTPTGDLIATPARGLFMGNRGGQFHTPDRKLLRRRWASRAWITCALAYKDHHEAIWVDHHYTQLFFLDEATALAAGHRPCALCRRADFNRFMASWAATRGGHPRPRVSEVDGVLHAERLASGDGAMRSKRTFAHDAGALPNGAFVAIDRAAYLVLGKTKREWTPGGYGRRIDRRGAGEVTVLTPKSIVKILAAGYAPVLHPSVRSRVTA